MRGSSKHYIDAFVGKIIRNRRKEARMSLKELAAAINLTQQQVQKYEKGENRISASKLYQIASVLKREVNFFFPSPADCQIQKDHNQNELSADVDAKWEAEHKENLLRLLKAYNLIAQAKVREQILLLVETLSKEHNSNNVN